MNQNQTYYEWYFSSDKAEVVHALAPSGSTTVCNRIVLHPTAYQDVIGLAPHCKWCERAIAERGKS